MSNWRCGNTYVNSHNIVLSGEDRVVAYDPAKRRFAPVNFQGCTVDRPLEVNLDISSELLNQHEKINIDFKMMIREKKITNDAEATIVKWINQLLKSPGYGKFVNAFCAARIVVY